MSRSLLTIGSLLMLATVLLWLAGSLGWISAAEADLWSGLAWKGGLVALAAGLAIRVLAPVGGAITQSRCEVCGKVTERGHTYCLDHLMETVNDTRDKTRGGMRPSSRPRPLP